jgi:hypothetical protein
VLLLLLLLPLLLLLLLLLLTSKSSALRHSGVPLLVASTHMHLQQEATRCVMYARRRSLSMTPMVTVQQATLVNVSQNPRIASWHGARHWLSCDWLAALLWMYVLCCVYLGLLNPPAAVFPAGFFVFVCLPAVAFAGVPNKLSPAAAAAAAAAASAALLSSEELLCIAVTCIVCTKSLSPCVIKHEYIIKLASGCYTCHAGPTGLYTSTLFETSRCSTLLACNGCGLQQRLVAVPAAAPVQLPQCGLQQRLVVVPCV